MKHANIAIFVPHLGCTHQCSFCNQHAITGKMKAPTPADVDLAVKESGLDFSGKCAEIAFFGGSFTAIPKDFMLSLLKAARVYVRNGTVSGIRISTRPDAISDKTLRLLKSYGVTAIELGAQSMSDETLLKNGRGHTARDIEDASKRIKSFGFKLGLQMMTGLYGGDDPMITAEKIAALSPDTVRIYPTIVLKQTKLCELYEQGLYRPQSLEEAVECGGKLLWYFWEKQIPVIRFGLHDIDKDNYVAGPWHPALRELCEARIYRNLTETRLENLPKGEYIITVAPSEISKMTGQKKENKLYFEQAGYGLFITGDSGLLPFEIKIKRK